MKQQNVELLQTLYEEYQGALRYTATRIGVNSDDVDESRIVSALLSKHMEIR